MSETKTGYANTTQISIEQAIEAKKKELHTLEEARFLLLAMKQSTDITLPTGPDVERGVPVVEGASKWPPPKPVEGVLPAIVSQLKVCPECGHTPRPIEAFGKDKSRPDGHARLCLLHARKARNQYNKPAKKHRSDPKSKRERSK